MTAPPYTTRGYDTDEEEAIMEATGTVRCETCDRTFASEHALRVHQAKAHKTRTAKTRKPKPSLAPIPFAGSPNGDIDHLVHELALALLDEALGRLREQVRGAL